MIGSELVSFAIGGVILDYAIGSRPWMTVVMTLLGLVVAGWHGFKLLLSAEAKK
ncbi:MAG: AtpZ/AtpI family protein [Gemmataceae bacterium]